MAQSQYIKLGWDSTAETSGLGHNWTGQDKTGRTNYIGNTICLSPHLYIHVSYTNNIEHKQQFQSFESLNL